MGISGQNGGSCFRMVTDVWTAAAFRDILQNPGILHLLQTENIGMQGGQCIADMLPSCRHSRRRVPEVICDDFHDAKGTRLQAELFFYFLCCMCNAGLIVPGYHWNIVPDYPVGKIVIGAGYRCVGILNDSFFFGFADVGTVSHRIQRIVIRPVEPVEGIAAAMEKNHM